MHLHLFFSCATLQPPPARDPPPLETAASYFPSKPTLPRGASHLRLPSKLGQSARQLSPHRAQEQLGRCVGFRSLIPVKEPRPWAGVPRERGSALEKDVSESLDKIPQMHSSRKRCCIYRESPKSPRVDMELQQRSVTRCGLNLIHMSMLWFELSTSLLLQEVVVALTSTWFAPPFWS